MISPDFIKDLCSKLEHIKIEVLGIKADYTGDEDSDNTIYIFDAMYKDYPEILRVYKSEREDEYVYVSITHNGMSECIFKIGKDWYVELPLIYDFDKPIITYVNFFSGGKEEIAVAVSYDTGNGNNGILDVPIDKFNEKIQEMGIRNIQKWEKKDFVKYKLLKDSHEVMFEEISFDLIDFEK